LHRTNRKADQIKAIEIKSLPPFIEAKECELKGGAK